MFRILFFKPVQKLSCNTIDLTFFNTRIQIKVLEQC
jgi:hypothetical protein